MIIPHTVGEERCVSFICKKKRGAVCGYTALTMQDLKVRTEMHTPIHTFVQRWRNRGKTTKNRPLSLVLFSGAFLTEYEKNPLEKVSYNPLENVS
jgi:hypothetical protein